MPRCRSRPASGDVGAGVVDQDVEPPKRSSAACERRARRQPRRRRRAPAPGSCRRRDRSRRRRRAPCRARGRRATTLAPAAASRRGDRRAQAAGGAGDERGAVVECNHRMPFLRSRGDRRHAAAHHAQARPGRGPRQAARPPHRVVDSISSSATRSQVKWRRARRRPAWPSDAASRRFACSCGQPLGQRLRIARRHQEAGDAVRPPCS